MAELEGQRSVTRRDVLKGGVAVAALGGVSAFLAACSSSGGSATPGSASAGSSTGASAAASATASESAGASASASASGSGAVGGTVKLGSNLSDDVPKKALQKIVDTFTSQTGTTVKINTVDHSTFQNTLTQYLQGTPDDAFTWFSGYRMRFFAAKGLAQQIDDVWQSLGSHFSDAMKTASTGDDKHQYLVPYVTYAWTVYYRKSLFQDKGYKIPTTLDEFKALAAKMQTDGLVPIGLGQKDGWPAMGHFDIINLRENGYQFHVDLMAGKEKWTDPRVADVFNVWKTLLPFYQSGSAGRIWQDAAAGLVQKKTGMMLQPQVGETFAAAGESEFADLDFFPWPNHGKQWDDEKALDAPIDGFLIAAKSPTLKDNLDAAKAFLEYVGQGSTQLEYTKANPSLVATAKDADPSGYTPLQKHQVEVIGQAQKLTQFLDRDSRPDFATSPGMQAFLTDFITNPNQDLNAFQTKIQQFWDGLPALS